MRAKPALQACSERRLGRPEEVVHQHVRKVGPLSSLAIATIDLTNFLSKLLLAEEG